MYSVLKENPDLVVLDDPISSFDGNKKFAIINMLFMGKHSLKNRTVLLLTHEFNTVIDAIYNMPYNFNPTAIGATGLAGGAAITTALAALGPGGILGGIATLGIIGLISEGIAQYGVDAIFSAVIKELYRKGETKEEILRKIKKYPISKELKRKLKENIEKV